MAASAHDFAFQTIDGAPLPLTTFKDKVVLVVNTASKCGLTPQYEGLQKLYTTYEKDGFVIIGVPANEFGKQEPGTEAEIKEFCSANYKVTFPMMAKVVVKGEKQVDLYKTLVAATPDKDGKLKQISWNFEKFLIGRDGKVAARFDPKVEPTADELAKAVKAELAKPAK